VEQEFSHLLGETKAMAELNQTLPCLLLLNFEAKVLEKQNSKYFSFFVSNGFGMALSKLIKTRILSHSQ